MRLRAATALALILLAPAISRPAAAQVKVGVIFSTTGPSASLGIPERDSLAMLPKGIGATAIEYVIMDDGSDPARAAAAARTLIDERKVDAIIGPSITPSSLAVMPIAAAGKVPVIALDLSAGVVLPMDAQRRWVFKTAQTDRLMADAIALHMFRAGVRTVGYIGFRDAYGDGWLTEAKRALGGMTIKLVAEERYARPDKDVSSQVARIMAAKPDAVLIGGSGVPATVPQIALHALGYAGKYYQTHGAAVQDFIKAGGEDVEGTVLPAGPVLVAAQLPDGSPVKSTAEDYVRQYETVHGRGSVATFGAFAFDAATVLRAAVPIAALTAKPGTQEFRMALRDALETTYDLTLTNGMVEMSAEDHNGFDRRARVMVAVQGGTWKLLP